ncbi:MAG: Na/Pi cotransporter family protein [Gammaproteobacteria bacterium]|nr:Na/Pi cotransporter family protein [Gammaproteobacteria bacterium]
MSRLLKISELDRKSKLLLVSFLGAFVWLATAPVLAAGEGGDPQWGWMIVKLLGGLSIFLFGMEQMADALKAVAGERMKIILAKLTTNRFMGALTGAFVTAIIQSSSVTTVLVVGFITAGLMSMAQSIGVIMGANIGTTITAQIVAFKVTKFALVMVTVGFGMLFFFKDEKIKHYGAMIMGLGLVFYGMSVMSEAMKPLRSYEPFLDLMTQMKNPLIGIMIAAAFTGLIQSSSATTGIVIVMASQGFISLEAGIALAFGANVGTCVTAALAAIGKPREAVRAALVHILFNTFGVLLWVLFIPNLVEFVTWMSPAADEATILAEQAAEGITNLTPEQIAMLILADESPRQIANAHTVFNVANTFIFIGFVGVFARIVEWLVPDKPMEEGIIVKPKYLDLELLETPSLALDRVRLELGDTGARINAMMTKIMPAILTGSQEDLKEIAKMDDEVDILHGQIVTYLGKLSQKALTEEQTQEFVKLMDAANDLENTGDIIETDLVGIGEERLRDSIAVSDATQEVLRKLHEIVSVAVELALESVMEKDQRAAREVISMKADINRLVESATRHEAQRLVAQEPNRLPAYTMEVEIIEKLKRIYYFAKRIAKSAVPAELAGKSA